MKLSCADVFQRVNACHAPRSGQSAVHSYSQNARLGLSTVHSYSQECTIGRRESNIPVITELALHSVTNKNRYSKNCVETVANEYKILSNASIEYACRPTQQR